MASSVVKTACSKSLFCQVDTGGPLVCPAFITRTDRGAGYVSLAENISTLNELEAIPEDATERLKEGGSFLETLQSKQAKFHKNCRSKYNKTIIECVKRTKKS